MGGGGGSPLTSKVGESIKGRARKEEEKVVEKASCREEKHQASLRAKDRVSECGSERVIPLPLYRA